MSGKAVSFKRQIMESTGTKDRPWGPEHFTGPFRILTYLDSSEREIDIDDRGAILVVKIELQEDSPFVANDVKVTLEWDFHGEHILIHGMQDGDQDSGRKGRGASAEEGSAAGEPGKGTLLLVGGEGDESVTIKPGPDNAHEAQIKISTGLWGVRNADGEAEPATPGRKTVRAHIECRLEPSEDSPGSPQRHEKARLQLKIAQD